MELILAWFAFSIVAGMIAHNKGRDPVGYFLLALLLTPLLGIVIALVINPRQAKIEARQLAKGERQRCPHCAELIRPDANFCRYCGNRLSDA